MNEHDKIIFPVHHKVKHRATSTIIGANNEDIDYNYGKIEEIITQAYKIAQEMSTFVGMDVQLIKKNVFNMDECSKMAKNYSTLIV